MLLFDDSYNMANFYQSPPVEPRHSYSTSASAPLSQYPTSDSGRSRLSDLSAKFQRTSMEAVDGPLTPGDTSVENSHGSQSSHSQKSPLGMGLDFLKTMSGKATKGWLVCAIGVTFTLATNTFK
jgi:hypothetical protein